MDEESALLEDSDKVIERVVGTLRKAAPKTLDREVEGRPSWQVLEDRLRAMPRPELVLLAAIVLRTPVSKWLEAVQEEQHP